jgi:hypothetical protein
MAEVFLPPSAFIAVDDTGKAIPVKLVQVGASYGPVNGLQAMVTILLLDKNKCVHVEGPDAGKLVQVYYPTAKFDATDGVLELHSKDPQAHPPIRFVSGSMGFTAMRRLYAIQIASATPSPPAKAVSDDNKKNEQT